MDKVVLLIQLLWILLSGVGGRNIFFRRPFCGSGPLQEIFIRYNCTYYEITESDGRTYTANEGKSGITECCESPCTEYYIVTRYCKTSNISQYINESQLDNQISREANSTRSNVIVRDNSSREEERSSTENKVRKGKKLSGWKRNSHKRFRSLSLLRKGDGKSCECRCRKRRAKVCFHSNTEINPYQYKPAVVVIKQTNTPVPIPNRRNVIF